MGVYNGSRGVAAAQSDFCPAMGKVLVCILSLLILGTSIYAEQKKESDNLADSSVTSYSTVVIHHPSTKDNKGSEVEAEEGRSQSYFKVKRVRASTEAPNTNGHNGGDYRTKKEADSKIRNERNKNSRGTNGESKKYQNDARSQKDDSKPQNSDFRPSQYIPESEMRVNFHTDKDQSGQAARHPEFVYGKDYNEPEFRKHEYNDDYQGERESSKWHRQQYRHKPRQQSEDPGPKSAPRHKQEDVKQFHREVYINHNYQPKEEKQRPQSSPQTDHFTTVGYSFETAHSVPANPSQHFSRGYEQRLRPIPPPGMSDELIETLLSQQPQTFDSEPKVLKTKNKSKGQTFKVGYSMSFGGGNDDVVVGKPKDVRLHVNGKNSVWKSLTNGVEMSQELDKKKPTALRLEDNSYRASDNVLKNDVYYIQDFQPDTTIPTSGRTSFDHSQALTHSNSFDFSNAMEPKWLKHPRALDMSAIYQSLGYPPPLPVLLPGGPRGEGTMVHAIVIPVEQIATFDYNWPQMSMVPLTGSQPIAQALALAPLVTASPLTQTQAPHHPSGSGRHSSSSGLHPTGSRHHDKGRFKSRAPKMVHKEVVVKQQGSFSSTPIVVAPAPHTISSSNSGSSRQPADIQQELNNILAEEMKRKNQRTPAVGLRPPPVF